MCCDVNGRGLMERSVELMTSAGGGDGTRSLAETRWWKMLHTTQLMTYVNLRVEIDQNIFVLKQLLSVF